MKRFRFSGRAAVICSLILALGLPTVAMGFGEGRNLLLGKRNPSSNPSLALNTETEIIADTTTYGTRQSNKRLGDGATRITINVPYSVATRLGSYLEAFTSPQHQGAGEEEVGGDAAQPERPAGP